ncbi:MAG: putative inorganic carbon transporter subunit DabA, partial [Pseudomonadota bacterium]
MNMISIAHHQKSSTIEAATKAGNAIPPVWPLATSVAVNPFLGQSDEPLTMTAARLARVGGIPVTMPREWYRDKLNNGELTDQDISAALSRSDAGLSLEAVKAALASPSAPLTSLPTVARLSSDVDEMDWPALIAERIGHWAAGYFDQGQALWQAPQKYGIWASWRRYARHDLTPEIMGLDGFARLVDEATDSSAEVIQNAVEKLQLSLPALETYFHALLMSLGGWAHVGRYQKWAAELAEQEDHSLHDLLAICLTWEVALLEKYRDQISSEWTRTIAAHARPLEPTSDMVID